MHFTTFQNLLDTTSDNYATRPFLLDDQQLGMVTYRDVSRFAKGLECHFNSLGIPAGSAVATVFHNCGIAALLFLSVIASRRLLVPLNPISSPQELAYMLERSGCVAVIVDPAHSLSDNYGNLRVVKVSDHRKYFSSLCGNDGSGAEIALSRDDRHSDAFAGEVVFTSGSTGFPKGVVLNEGSLLANAAALVDAYSLDSDDRFLTVCPLFHNSGQVFTTLACAMAGGSTVAVKSSAGMLRFWSYIDKHRPTWSFGMVSFLAVLLSRPEVPTDTTFMRGILTGGSALDAALVQRFESRFHIPVRTVYGLTETASIATCEHLNPAPRSYGSSGRPLAKCKVVIDSSGYEQQSDTPKTGQILISGPTVFDRYINDPELTAIRKLDGWMHTGDVGYFDDSGNLFVIDRVDSMLIVGGENIYPAEVERLCHYLPGATQILLVGVDDAIWGKELVLVYKAADDKPSIQVWRQILEEQVAVIKLPRRYISIRDLGIVDFPRRENGKIDRRAITALVSTVKRQQGTTS